MVAAGSAALREEPCLQYLHRLLDAPTHRPINVLKFAALNVKSASLRPGPPKGSVQIPHVPNPVETPVALPKATRVTRTKMTAREVDDPFH